MKLFKFLKMIHYAHSVKFDVQTANPIENLAFKTVYTVKFNSSKFLCHNKLTTFDSVIFTMFVIRFMAINLINDRKKSELFSKVYISKVLDYYPEWKKLSQKYDLNFFENRVNYYESIIINSDIFDEESPIEQIINAFEFVITYDLSGQYEKIDSSTPVIIGDMFENFKIRMDIVAYYKAYFENTFIPALNDVCDYLNNL